jgi:hypothetical protein
MIFKRCKLFNDRKKELQPKKKATNVHISSKFRLKIIGDLYTQKRNIL